MSIRKADDKDGYDKALHAMTNHMTAEVLTYLNKREKEGGNIFAKELALNFVSKLVSCLVYKTLQERPTETIEGEQLADYVTANFATFKSGIQDAIATSFQAAMSQYSGKAIDYYCQIKLVPEVTKAGPIC
jgi:hypothetical protein